MTALFANVPIAICFSMMSPILPKMAHDLAHGPADAYLVKMTIGIVGIAMVAGAPLAGYLADKIGRGPLLFLSGLLFAGAGIVPAVTENLYVILGSRFFVGIAAMSFGTLGATIVGDYFEEVERPRLMGALVSIAMIAALITVPISGFMGDAGWHWPFLLHLTGVPLAIVAWFGVNNSLPVSRAEVMRPRATPEDDESTAPIPKGLIVLAFFVGLFIYTPSIYAPFRLRELGVDHPSMVAISLTVNGLVSSVIAWYFGGVRKVFSSRFLFAFSMGVFALGMAALAVTPAYSLALVGLFFIGVGMAWLPSNLLALAVMAVEERSRARAMGWIRSAEALAPAAGITLLEPLARYFGFEPVLLLIAGLAGVIFSMMLTDKSAALLMPDGAA